MSDCFVYPQQVTELQFCPVPTKQNICSAPASAQLTVCATSYTGLTDIHVHQGQSWVHSVHSPCHETGTCDFWFLS